MSNKINPFNLKTSISDQVGTISQQTNLGPRNISSDKGYLSNLPERNISFDQIYKAVQLYKGGDGNVVEVEGIKYLMTEGGLCLLTEAEEIITTG